MRAERLLQLVQELRRAKRVLTAAQLAERLEVTPRTIYRDIQVLVGMGTPIRGERGVGYVLDRAYDVPPLMFDADELEALMLGARMIAAQADDQTVEAANAAIQKILAVVPPERRTWLTDAPLFALSFRPRAPDPIDLVPLRGAFRTQHKVRLRYRDRKGALTERVLWPLSLGFIDGNVSLVAWCEKREGFRHFRTDRMIELTVLSECFPGDRAAYLASWRAMMEVELAGRPVRGSMR